MHSAPDPERPQGGRLLKVGNFPAAGESRRDAFGIEHWPRSWPVVGGFETGRFCVEPKAVI